MTESLDQKENKIPYVIEGQFSKTLTSKKTHKKKMTVHEMLNFKGNFLENEQQSSEPRYSCPETGAHFEFGNMCLRLDLARHEKETQLGDNQNQTAQDKPEIFVQEAKEDLNNRENKQRIIDFEDSSNAMSSLLPVTMDFGWTSGPTKRTSKVEAPQLSQIKKDSLHMGGFSSEGGATQSYRIPEVNEEEEKKSSDDHIRNEMPNRTSTEDIGFLNVKNVGLVKDRVAAYSTHRQQKSVIFQDNLDQQLLGPSEKDDQTAYAQPQIQITFNDQPGYSSHDITTQDKKSQQAPNLKDPLAINYREGEKSHMENTQHQIGEITEGCLIQRLGTPLLTETATGRAFLSDNIQRKSSMDRNNVTVVGIQLKRNLEENSVIIMKEAVSQDEQSKQLDPILLQVDDNLAANIRTRSNGLRDGSVDSKTMLPMRVSEGLELEQLSQSVHKSALIDNQAFAQRGAPLSNLGTQMQRYSDNQPKDDSTLSILQGEPSLELSDAKPSQSPGYNSQYPTKIKEHAGLGKEQNALTQNEYTTKVTESDQQLNKAQRKNVKKVNEDLWLAGGINVQDSEDVFIPNFSQAENNQLKRTVHFDSDIQQVNIEVTTSYNQRKTIKQSKSNKEDILLQNLQNHERQSQTSKSVESLPPVEVVIQSSLSLKNFKRGNYPEVQEAKYLHDQYFAQNQALGSENSPYKVLAKRSEDFNAQSIDAFAFAHESNYIAPKDQSSQRKSRDRIQRHLKFTAEVQLDEMAKKLKQKADLRKLQDINLPYRECLMGIDNGQPGQPIQQLEQQFFNRIQIDSREYSLENRQHKRFLEAYKQQILSAEEKDQIFLPKRVSSPNVYSTGTANVALNGGYNSIKFLARQRKKDWPQSLKGHGSETRVFDSTELIERVVKNKAFDPMPISGEVNSTLIARRAAEYAMAKLQKAVQWERLEENIRQRSNSPQQHNRKESRTTISKTSSNKQSGQGVYTIVNSSSLGDIPQIAIVGSSLNTISRKDNHSSMSPHSKIPSSILNNQLFQPKIQTQFKQIRLEPIDELPLVSKSIPGAQKQQMTYDETTFSNPSLEQQYPVPQTLPSTNISSQALTKPPRIPNEIKIKNKKRKVILSPQENDKLKIEYKPILQERKLIQKESILQFGVPLNFGQFRLPMTPQIKSKPNSRPCTSKHSRKSSNEPQKVDFKMFSQGALVEVKETIHQYHQDENRVVIRPFSATAKPSLAPNKSTKALLPQSPLNIGANHLSKTLQKLALSAKAAPAPNRNVNTQQRSSAFKERERDGVCIAGKRPLLSYQSALNTLFI